MARRPQPNVDAELAALEELPNERAAKVEALRRALAGHYRIAAKAARAAEDALLYELIPSLESSFTRFLDKPSKSDPSCFAKKALARALVALESNNVEFFSKGLTLSQLEPVWGGTADTAADVRASCAMGLVASGYPRALVELTALLNDSEAAARIGAVRAIACGNPREAELLLRAKALAGDAEPQVVGECFTGLLAVEPDESLEFVVQHLSHADAAVRELAVLTLGESRLDAALAPLKEAWAGVLVDEEFRRTLLRAAAAHRSEAAFDWLLTIVAESRVPVALEAVEALAVYRHNEKRKERLEAAVLERGDKQLSGRFAELWH